MTLPVPEGMDLLQGGTFSSALLTMHDAIVTNCEFRKGQTILIQQDQINFSLTAMEVALHNGQPLVDQPLRGKLFRVPAGVFLTA